LTTSSRPRLPSKTVEQEAGLIKEGEKYKDIQKISNYRRVVARVVAAAVQVVTDVTLFSFIN